MVDDICNVGITRHDVVPYRFDLLSLNVVYALILDKAFVCLRPASEHALVGPRNVVEHDPTAGANQPLGQCEVREHVLEVVASVDVREVEAHLPLKPAHFHILLSLLEEARHGYGIRRVVDERTGGSIVLAAGTLYETLPRLEVKGLIEETTVPEGAEVEASSRWRFYRATGLGRSVVRAELARLEADVAAARAELAVEG